MSCGCASKKSSGCTTTTNCCEDEGCPEICAALIVTNSWNVPACSNSAVLSVPGLTTALIGSYVWNPTYGWFRITGFDSVNGQLTVLNECLAQNAAPGTVVPAETLFVFGAPPGGTNITFAAYSSGTNYDLTTISAAVDYGTTDPVITITQPGTYLLIAQIMFTADTLTSSGNFLATVLHRTNNTPADVPNTSMFMRVLTDPAPSAYSGLIETVAFPATIYTTINATDQLTIYANYSSAIVSGDIQADTSSILAVKLY